MSVNLYPESILSLITSLARLPGIGRKTAERLSMHILHAPEHEVKQLAADLLRLKSSVHLCSTCFALCDGDHCKICTNPARDKSIICVVENPADMASIEKSGAFSGVYHILGGALSPMDGIGPDEIRLKELFARAAHPSAREIIIATGTDVEGEATASYISDSLNGKNLKITRIASGIPMGGDLQYVDQVTMQRALEGWHGF
ncbi:MAG: recombination mediator RecR [Thermodesulfobacteriota bacterium]|nr:recombination mediator RecR [Thermodesulfobacteriota bacterium]